jgi:hypothetical protein
MNIPDIALIIRVMHDTALKNRAEGKKYLPVKVDTVLAVIQLVESLQEDARLLRKTIETIPENEALAADLVELVKKHNLINGPGWEDM